MLPSKSLEPYYARVTWLYVCRLFKDGDPKDQEALRTHERFGISSWPQMFVFDPRTSKVLREMPRDLKRFIATFDTVLAGWKAGTPRGKKLAQSIAEARALKKGGQASEALARLRPLARRRDEFEAWLEARELLRAWQGKKPATPAERLQDPDPRERALALEVLEQGELGNLRARIRELLLDPDEDIVVRFRALRALARDAPRSILDHASALLELPNDPWRYAILGLAQQDPDPSLNAKLTRLFAEAGRKIPSRNPNVLRMQVARCLALSGDMESLQVLAGPIRAASPNNSLTRLAIGAAAGIARRARGKDRKRALGLLLEGLPPAVGGDTMLSRRSLAVVRAVIGGFAEVLDRDRVPEVPGSWTKNDRERLREQLRSLIAR